MSRRKVAKWSGLSPAETGTILPCATVSWRPIIFAAGLIVAATVAAYCNSFEGPFVYDDEKSVLENPTIRRLWPIWRVLSPPSDGETVGGRPLLNLSFAMNYALGGLNVWGYHVTNLLIHIAAALLLFGILRRTFLTPALRDRFGQAATPLALACALVWALHPLQTESVTYLVQRAESLAGLCYLLTLYCVIRGAEAASGTVPFFAAADLTLPSDAAGKKGDCPPWPDPALPTTPAGEKGDCPLSLPWYTFAALACLLGMATKEVMVTAPLMVLLYDRTFLSGSWAEALRRRWRLYLALAATWGLLACLLLSTRLLFRQAEMGAPDALSYVRTQPGVIAYYLRLSLWPQPLCFDYAWPVANTLGDILPGALIVASLVAATTWGLLARKAWAFLGAWFLLILAPTSSILPLGQMAFEHRLYLSLAAVVVLVVAGGYALWDRLLRLASKGGQSPSSPATLLGKIGLLAAKKGTVPAAKKLRVARGVEVVRWAVPVVLWAAVLLALACATAARNRDYRSAISIYQDTVNKRPHNPVAHNNLGFALAKAGRLEEAMAHYHEALHWKLDYAEAQGNLGLALGQLGRADEAVAYFREVLRQRPDFAAAHNLLGAFLADSGKTAEAIEHYREALRLKPEFPVAHNNLGKELADAGRFEEAIEHYRAALRVKPSYAEAHNNLGLALAAVGRWSEAIEHYQQALYLQPEYFEARGHLGIALSGLGKIDEAIEQLQQVVRARPDDAKAHNNLGYALATVGRTSEATQQYHQCLQLAPDSIEAHLNLAWLLATHEAAQGGDPGRAVLLAQRARKLSRQENAQCLDTLAAAYAAAGRFAEAVATAERAVPLAESPGQATLAQQIQVRLELYRAGRPYRQSPRALGPNSP